MALLDVDVIAAYRWIYGSSQLAWSKGRRPRGAVLHSSDESGDLLQWLSYDNSTINIVVSTTFAVTVIS